MPMRNAEAFVAAALRSVLGQAGVDLEIIVVDDGSTDGSVDAVRQINDARIRVIPGPQEGIAAAFNAGLSAARGTWLARCDADDVYPKHRLSRQIEWLADHPHFGAIGGGFTTISRRGSLITEMDCGEGAQEITHELQAGTARTSFCTFLVRTELLRQIGGCRSFFTTAEDIDLLLRLGEITRVWFDPESVYRYRLHDSSITHSSGKPLQLFFESCARRFQQQRLSGKADDLQRNIVPRLPDCSAHHAPSSEQIQGLLLWTAWEQHGSGRKFRSILTGVRAGLSRPTKLPVWKSIAALVIKPSGLAKRGAARVPTRAAGR